MWPVSFEERLQQWHKLREDVVSLPLISQLHAINNWWFRAPIINRNLRWDNHREWPGPWDLLAEDRWCDLARALGIVYTINIINDDADVSLAQCQEGNLVLVEQGKYILNWAPGELLNIDSMNLTILRQIDGVEIKQQHLG
jgi:hypothetical protein